MLRRRISIAILTLVGSGLSGHSALAGTCDADLDASGTVGFADLLDLLAAWGPCQLPSPPGRGVRGEGGCQEDLDSSGDVAFADLLILLAAWNETCEPISPPEVIYTHIAHEGDPAPGIDFRGAYLGVLLTPQIDAEGNVLFKSFLGAPDLTEVGNQAVFYGPPGAVTKLVWETDPAPGFPEGVFIKSLFAAEERLSESGSVAFNADLEGPGIIPGVNDQVIYFGDPCAPDSFQIVMQKGGQAPDLDPGIVIQSCPTCTGFGIFTISDNGTMLIPGDIFGPGVTAANDRVIWTGTPGNLQVVWREGMHAPGTPEGVVFGWADLLSVNDAGQIAFRSSVTGPGITDDNDSGRWAGGPGTLQVVGWPGLPAPGLPPGTTFLTAGGGGNSALNGAGDAHEVALVDGPGVTAANNLVLFAGQPEAMTLVMREGDQLSEAGKDVFAGSSFGNCFISNQSHAFFSVRLAGPAHDGLNQWAAYFGPYESPKLELLEGDPAPGLEEGITLSRVVLTASRTALNDSGGIVTVSEIDGPDVTDATRTVLWMKVVALDGWLPLVRGGDEIDGRTVFLPTTGAFSGDFWQQTGGGDGHGLSFNDAGILAVKLEFTDSSHGIYVVQTNRQ